jgi:hypothetical protein
MKRKTLSIGLIVFLFVPLISVMPTTKADEMFFVNFYAVDSQGTPLNGVKIEATGSYGYHEFVYTGSNGYAPRLALISDLRNAHYTWTATYQHDSESGDFYVPINYNDVNIVMSDVNVPTPTPNQTPSTTPTIAPSPTLAPTSNPTSSPTASPIPTPTPTTSLTPSPTQNPTTVPTQAPTSQPTANPTMNTSISPTANPTPTQTVPELPSLLVLTILALMLSISIVAIGRSRVFSKLFSI